jgi:uncharacterized membrane protein YedE/YeeE
MKNKATQKNLLPKKQNLDAETCPLDTSYIKVSQHEYRWHHNFKYIVIGILFCIVLVKGEVISWFRIQEMFALQSFHMYGIMGTAIVVGITSVSFIKKFNVKTIYGDPIEFHKKKFSNGQIYGGLLFGFGWALTGACPGPIYAQIGMGIFVVVIVLISALAGTWVYGYLRENLPH